MKAIPIIAIAALFANLAAPAAAAVPASSPSIVQAAASADSSTVSGTVRDDEGAPLAGAAVTLKGPQSYSARTDAHGTFTIAGVVPGVYSVAIQKAGYDTATEPDLAVVASSSQTLAVTMHGATLTSLRTIATVRAAGPGTFNTSTAAVNVVSSQTFEEQAQPQVTRVLNQIPGVQISLPSSSANGAAPGAITFPNIRGALSYETASLIDGHPLSVGEYGDYVTTFLSSYLLGGVEVVKGPGAMSPQTNYAIGGTVNFRTKDPTLKPTPYYTFGFDSHGGTVTNFGVSDTVGKLGFVFDYASYNTDSAVNGQQLYFNPTSSGAVCPAGGTPGSSCYVLYNSTVTAPRPSYIPGTASKMNNNFPLVACCYPVYGTYNGQGELAKLRYKFSDATVATVSYLGSQTTANQNGNLSSLTPSLFTPGVNYTGTDFLANSPFMMSSVFAGTPEIETNNEPIFQAEIRSTLGRDTVLARWYHANIARIINAGNSVDQATVQYAKLWGSGYDGNGQQVAYDGQTVPIYFYNFYNQNEIDSLQGYSLEYDHPFSGTNTLTAAWNITDSRTTTGTLSSDDAFSSGNVKTGLAYWSNVTPHGAGQVFNTFLLRDRANLSPRLDATLSLYANTYNSAFPTASPPPDANLASGSAPTPYQNNWQLSGNTTRHFDGRLGLTYRPTTSTVVRLAAGSSIAPPYIALLSQLNGTPSQNRSTGDYLQTINAGTLKPETAFGWDLGADWRMHDGSTFISGDVYQTNLFNAFITQVYDTGLQCTDDTSKQGAAGFYVSTACVNPGELFRKSNVNLSNERYQGVELQIRRMAAVGFNYRLAGGLQRGYAYNLGPCFYSTTAGKCNSYDTNLAIIPGQNNSGNGIYSTGGVLNGFSNQSIPYFNGNAELSYRFAGGTFASVGSTFYGKNNSLFEKPFAISYATVSVPINDNIAFQVSGDNIFNTLSGLFPINGGGVPIPLAGIPTNAPIGTPAMAATYGNVLGPATWRFLITKSFGSGTARSKNSSR